jgi:hypothetical protein
VSSFFTFLSVISAEKETILIVCLEVGIPGNTLHIDYSDSQFPPSEDYLYSDVDYPIEVYSS